MAASGFAVAVILIGWLSGAFGFFLEMETKPIAKEAAEEAVQIHELKMEPRLQSIEYEVTEQRKVANESLDVQKKTLEVLEKIEAK